MAALICCQPSSSAKTRARTRKQGVYVPFASVVKVTAEQLTEALGPSLVVTAITSDANLINRLVPPQMSNRLNIGAGAHESDQLGPTARGQSFRTPLRA